MVHLSFAPFAWSAWLNAKNPKASRNSANPPNTQPIRARLEFVRRFLPSDLAFHARGDPNSNESLTDGAPVGKVPLDSGIPIACGEETGRGGVGGGGVAPGGSGGVRCATGAWLNSPTVIFNCLRQSRQIAPLPGTFSVATLSVRQRLQRMTAESEVALFSPTIKCLGCVPWQHSTYDRGGVATVDLKPVAGREIKSN
jgi:hypothetical protein